MDQVLRGWIIKAILQFLVAVVTPKGLLLALNRVSIFILVSIRMLMLCLKSIIVDVKVLSRAIVRNTITTPNHVRFLVVCSSSCIHYFPVIFVDEALIVDISWCATTYTPWEPNPLTYEFMRWLVLLADIILLNSDFCCRLRLMKL